MPCWHSAKGWRLVGYLAGCLLWLAHLKTPFQTPALARSQAPHLARLGGEIRLFLPPRMQQALTQALPGFKPWRWDHYMPLITRDYRANWHQAPFAVIADFNGDQQLDAVIHGHTQAESLELVLLSQGLNWRVLILARGPYIDPATELYGWPAEPEAGRGRFLFLTYVSPGRYQSGYETQPLRLRHAGFTENYWGKAALTRYWNGQGFASYTTAD